MLEKALQAFMSKKNLYMIAIAVLIIVAGLFAYSEYSGVSPINTVSGAANSVFVSLTDPANVPSGTTALTVNYSDIQLHVSHGSSSGWITVNGAGSVNLLSIINITTVLGSVNLSNGSVIDMARFNITSGSIDINNTAYPLFIPSHMVKGNVSLSPAVNGTENLVMDLSPTVVTIFTANSTVFILVPSVRAVMVGAGKAQLIGGRENMSSDLKRHFDDITPSVSISGVSLSSIGNTSSLSLTVTDNSNKSALLQHVLVFGNLSTSINMSAINGILANLSGGRSTKGNISGGSENGSDQAEVNVTQVERNSIMHLGALNFFISSNGSLILPFDRIAPAVSVLMPCYELPPQPAFNDNFTHAVPAVKERFDGLGEILPGSVSGSENEVVQTHINSCISDIGYRISADSSVTLSFNGPISMGFGRILIGFLSGSNYKITLQGEDGVHASVNATAS